VLSTSSTNNASDQSQWIGVGRAVGGAFVFGLPLMMTMEMWQMGLYIEPFRLLALILISLPVLVCVSSVIGFRESRELLDNIIDVFVAYAFGLVISFLTLLLFNAISWDNFIEINFKIVMLQAIPASFGALLARSEIGSGEHDASIEQGGIDYLAVLAIGAIYLGFNVAPTEEIQLIAYQMSPWHQLALFMTTLVVMHIFSEAGSFSSVSTRGAHTKWLVSLSNTSTAFVVALVASVLLLWVFGHLDGLAFPQIVANTIVLLFPAGIGAAAAKLII
jgi:putative integral membrane protein (TIGR02587 family)